MTGTTAAEHDRPVIAKRLYWDESGAHYVADAWERDGLALGSPVHSTGVFPQQVRCGNREYTLYVVLAYGPLPSETA